MRIVLAGVLASIAFVVNPLAACNGTPTYDFGDKEMRAAVEGKWIVVHGDRRTTVVIREAKAAEHASAGYGLIATASACGTRSFVAEAGACLDASEMMLVATAETGEVLDGKLFVAGTSFARGEVELTGDIGHDHVAVSAYVAPDGRAETLDPARRGSTYLTR